MVEQVNDIGANIERLVPEPRQPQHRRDVDPRIPPVSRSLVNSSRDSPLP